MTTELDPLDGMLDAAAPRGADDHAGLRAELAAMTGDARRSARPARARRRVTVALGAGLAAVLVGSAGVAAASDYFDWAPWSQNPVAAYEYTLPSGVACEVRVGNLDLYDNDLEPIAEAQLKDWYARTDVLGLVEERLPARIAESREGSHMHVLDDGTEVEAGYGTEYYDQDREYSSAFDQLVHQMIFEELVRLGYDREQVRGLEGAGHCPGLDE